MCTQNNSRAHRRQVPGPILGQTQAWLRGGLEQPESESGGSLTAVSNGSIYSILVHSKRISFMAPRLFVRCRHSCVLYLFFSVQSPQYSSFSAQFPVPIYHSHSHSHTNTKLLYILTQYKRTSFPEWPFYWKAFHMYV